MSWFDWQLLQRHQEVFRFTREMIALRKRHELLRKERFYTAADIHWFNARGEPPQWNGPGRTLGCVVNAQDRAEPALCLLFNAEPAAVEFVLQPPPAGHTWRVIVDTAQAPPRDIHVPGDEPVLDEQGRYRLENRSLAILLSG